MMRLLLLASVLLLSSCGLIGPDKITDFSDRSVAYGWLDIDNIDANRLHSVVVYQHQPTTSKPNYHLAVKKLGDGYLYYTFALANGVYSVLSTSGQKCFGLCTNTVYTYEFGDPDKPHNAQRIQQPGVYYFGAHSLQKIKTGFFRQGKFDALPASNAPSQKQMLQAMLEDAARLPQVKARLVEEIRRLD